MTPGVEHCGSVFEVWGPLSVEAAFRGRLATQTSLLGIRSVSEGSHDPLLEKVPGHPPSCKDGGLRLADVGSSQVIESVGQVLGSSCAEYLLGRQLGGEEG